MAIKILAAACLVVLMSTPEMVRSLRKCSCIDRMPWDCSFLAKSIILPEEECWRNNWLLQHNNFRDIPEYINTYMDVVDLSYNLLGIDQRISDGSKSHFIYVDHLDVSRNYLKSLDIFSGSRIGTLVANDNKIFDINEIKKPTVLYQLILARNNITRISSSLDLEFLSYLDLSGNPLLSISEDAFEELDRLITLHLNNTQTLSELKNHVFQNTTALKHLSLNNNKLANLPEDLFSRLNYLEELFLQVNNLNDLPLGIFRNLHRLRLLNLDFNQLTELPEELFSRLHSLEDLSVRGNRLTTLPVLRLSTGPISTVTFADNLIKSVDEAAVRALLRDGFLYGDVTENPVDEESLSWIGDVNDLELSGWDDAGTTLDRDSTDCRNIRMPAASNHGYISFCVHA